MEKNSRCWVKLLATCDCLVEGILVIGFKAGMETWGQLLQLLPVSRSEISRV